MNRNINWFPGHMAKNTRLILTNLKLVNVVYYIVDARAPLSSFNLSFLKQIKNKKIIILINKSDLVLKKDLQLFIIFFQKKGFECFLSNCFENKLFFNTLIKKTQKKTSLQSITKILILGMPNVGKSTLLNKFCQKNKAITKNMMATTKRINWYSNFDNVFFLDTPGIALTKVLTKEQGYILSLLKIIKYDAFFLEDIIYFLLQYLHNFYYENLLKYLGLSKKSKTSFSYEEIIKNIALQKKCYTKEKINLDKLLVLIFNDFQKQKMGKIILDLNFSF